MNPDAIDGVLFLALAIAAVFYYLSFREMRRRELADEARHEQLLQLIRQMQRQIKACQEEGEFEADNDQMEH